MSMSIDEFIKAAQAKATSASACASEIARVNEQRVKNISDGSPELNEISLLVQTQLMKVVYLVSMEMLKLKSLQRIITSCSHHWKLTGTRTPHWRQS